MKYEYTLRVFNSYEYKIELVAQPFANLRYRDRTFLIVCKDASGKFLLGAKKEYPEGIVRLMGGGVNKGEDLVLAGIREIKEEMNIDVTSEEVIPLAQVRVEGHYQGQTFIHTVSIFFLNSVKDDAVAGDDVSHFVAYTEDDYRQLIQRYSDLKPDYLYGSGENSFSWGDYGKVYAFVHQVAIEETLKRKL